VIGVASRPRSDLHFDLSTEIRKRDPLELFARLEIDDDKAVETRQAREHPLRRAISVRAERQRTGPVRKLDRSHVGFSLLIDNRRRKGLIVGGGNDIAAVRCDERVVDSHPVQGESLGIG
jgi:hypothetical protein